MVRIKHRYLLLNILYPSSPPSTTITTTPSNAPYLSFHAPSPPHLNPLLLLAHLRNSIATHFGDTGLGLVTGSLKCIYFSRATSTAIIRCPRAHARLVWASLTFMSELPGKRKGERGESCVFRVVRVSGTIRKSEEELIRRAKGEVVRAKVAEERGEGDLLGRLLGPEKVASGALDGIVDIADEELDADEESE